MGWGSSTRRGGGRKVRALPRKFVLLGFRREESGMSQEFCQGVPDPWGRSKSLCKKSSRAFLSTSDFQSEVGEVFGEIGGELPAKFGRRFSSFFYWGNRQKHFPPRLHRKFHHQTSLRGSGLWRALHLPLPRR